MRNVKCFGSVSLSHILERMMQKKNDQKIIKSTLKKDDPKTLVFQTPRGMRDILPGEQAYWVHIDRLLQKAVQEFGFSRIQTPVVEFSNLYQRAVGEATDIIEKEMYSFLSRGGDRLALRPELTAGNVRAFIQHGMHILPKPIKLFSHGPVFRYDRPQEGRYREHYQANFDVYGEADPILDAQMIQMASRVLGGLGLKKVQFQLNSIGCKQCRKDYKKLLVSYFRSKKQRLCQDCKRRLEKNPLRILDCKEEKCSQIKSSVPQSVDHLCKECHDHFKNLLEYLDELELSYQINPFLVRGLDYYNRTVFEIWPLEENEEGKRMSLGGGGRYDDLIESMGGESVSAIGFGIGLDRVVLQMQRERTKIYREPTPKVFLAQLGDLAKKKSLKLFSQIEKNGILIAESFGRGSLKSQLRQASKIGAEIALILGQKEALDGTVIVKDMISGSQEIIAQDQIPDTVKKMLKSNLVVKHIA